MSRAHRIAAPLAGLFLSAGAVVAVAPSASAGGVRPLPEAFTGTASFTYTGAPETWTVPAGVTSIVVTACGASGESMADAESPNVKFAGRPGRGGCVTAAVLVAPGDVVAVRVGGYPRAAGPTSTAGWPDGGQMNCPDVACGGGGGGSSDIRIGGDALADRVLVGGGGGGGGGGALGGAGGSGGNDTLDGFGGRGFPGVGMVAPELDVMAGGGGAFAQELNGGCGIVTETDLTPTCSQFTHVSWTFPNGASGVDNQGGNSAIADTDIGGAGGGGWFGGGSGCSFNSVGQTDLGTCGGGGGSSYADPARTDQVQYSQGTAQWFLDFLSGVTTRGDDGSVTIRWPGPAVVVTTTTQAVTTTTTTLAPTTTTIGSTTTDLGPGSGGLPATGGRNGSLPAAVALVGVGLLLTLLARRTQSSRT